MGDFITFLTYIESEKLTMAKFIILMITLVILMLIYKAPDIYRIYKEFERKDNENFYMGHIGRQ